jgi:hypothetical protein
LEKQSVGQGKSPFLIPYTKRSVESIAELKKLWDETIEGYIRVIRLPL